MTDAKSSEKTAESKPAITIKKYANRRLYNTGTSTYVTLDDLANLVKTGDDFVVVDAKTGEDITRSVLTQIIFEQESRGGNMLPVSFLRQLIGFYGDQMQSLVPSYLDFTMQSLTNEQGKLREQMTRAFGAQALEAITPRTRVLAIGHASNLDGTRISDEDLKTLADRVHAVGGVLVLDAAQTVPHRHVDVQALGVDFLACSIHKMCGPTAMGALYGRKESLTALRPFIVGGDTVSDTWLDRVEYKLPPGRFEAGLQHYAGMVGTAAAIRYVRDHVGFEAIEAHERRLNRHLTHRLLPLLGDHLQLLGPVDADQRGGVLTLASHSGALINAIERQADRQANVMVRVGMFCSNAYLHERFDTRGSAANNLRVSVYFYNTLDELDVFADVVEGVLADPVAAMDEGA